MSAMEKPALTEALQQLASLLPVALECCTSSDTESQNSAVIDKIRSVLLDVIGTITRDKGSSKQLLALLKVLQIVMDKLPAAFATSVQQYMLIISIVQLLGRLDLSKGAVEEQQLPILCSLAHLLEQQDRQLLLEIHASTVDLLLDLEHLMFEMSLPSSRVANLQLPLFQGLLVAAQQQLTVTSCHTQHEQPDGSQQQRVQQLTASEPPLVPVRDAATWQAFVTLGLHFLLHQLQEYPVLLGSLTPCALVPALGQMLSYPSSNVQELCLNVMGMMVVHQQDTAMASSVLHNVIWLLECATEGHIPADLCTSTWQVAAAGCVSACTVALDSSGLLEVAGNRLVCCLCKVVSAQPMQQQQVLWMSLLWDVLVACPAHSAIAALALPLTVVPAGKQDHGDGGLAAAQDALLRNWKAVGTWSASEGVSGIMERQMLLLLSMTPAAPSASGEPADEGANSPLKKKRRKLKQAQLTVTERGFLSSQRPGKSSSQQPSDTTPSASSTPPTAASLAAESVQQQLAMQHPDLVVAAAARMAGLIACLGPNSPIPAAFAVAVGLPSVSAAGARGQDSAAADQDDMENVATHKVKVLLLVLKGLLANPDVPASLLALASQQLVAWLPRAASDPQLMAELLPALLLALVATVGSTAVEPAVADIHRKAWQGAIDWMQGAGSIYSTGVAGPPSPILAATSVAWFTLSKLLQWAGTAPVSAAAAQMHANCTSHDPVRVIAAVQLLPIMCLLQHGHFQLDQQEGQQTAVGVAQHQPLLLQLSNGRQQAFSSFLESLPALSAEGAAALQLCSVVSLSQMLAASASCITALDVAKWLQTAAQAVLRVHSFDSRADTLARLQVFLNSHQPPQRAGTGQAPQQQQQQQQQLPALKELLPVLQPALAGNRTSSDNTDTTVKHHRAQAAALQLLTQYLAAVRQPELLAGSRQLLMGALDSVLSAHSIVRDAALELVQQYLRPAVLQEAFGGTEQQEPQRPASRGGKRRPEVAAARALHAEASHAVASTKRRLLEHLQQLLQQAGKQPEDSKQQQHATRAPESVVAAKTSLLRAIAGLYEGLIGSDCEELPLLCLLEQQCPAICPDDRVQAAALDLMQYLANRHTSSREPGQLLLDSQAASALLTYVGKALANKPQLFAQLASAAKVDEGQLAEAVAPYVVHWLCQQKLSEPLQLLATKLGQSVSSLFLSKSDEVLAEQLWFDPDGLAGLIEWVDEIMAPDSTFFTVVRVMGRRMARCVIEKAGLACFWGTEFHPPKSVLERATEYVATLADVMKDEGIHGVIDLLQGETIATVLKNIGKSLAKQPQQEQLSGAADAQQQGSDAGNAGGGSLWAEKLQSLRCLVVLMHLLEEHIGSHAFQLMAVLSEALLYCTSGDPLMQALAGWLSFTQLLAAHAPEVLQRVAAQAAVVLLPVLELTSQAGASSLVTAEDPTAVSAVDASAVQLAAEVLHEIVVKQRASVRPALRKMPPLPSLDILKEVNTVLAQEQKCQGPLQQLQLLIAALRHESVAVRHVGLGEVRSFLLQYKTFMGDAMAGLLSCSGPAALPGTTTTSAAGVKSAKSAKASDGVKLQPQQCRELYSELLSALLASCDNLPRSTTQLVESMKERCAQCLGLLGAIDPAHVSPELPRPAPFRYNTESCLVALVEQHLVRVLQTACDIGQLEVTSYAIQQILQHFTKRQLAKAVRSMETFNTTVDGGVGVDTTSSPDEPGSLYSLLDDTSKSMLKPFLTTKFIVTSRPSSAPGVVFGSTLNFRRWLHAWLKVLCSQTKGPLAFAFEACRGVAFWDQPLMMYLLPYMLVEVAGQGGEGLQLIIQELTAVMQCAAGGPEGHVENIELYVHCIFTQLDLLQQWVIGQQEACEKAAERAAQIAAQQAAAAGNGRAAPKTPEPQLPPFVANVAALVYAVPIQTMAEAALRCGSYARALQCFEVHVRAKHGGGLNPSAYNGGCSSYNYDDVSFLLEVYGHLEEPDGLAGLVQLRQGGLTAADQILVAEKAGDWSEALALYEQALAQEALAAAAPPAVEGLKAPSNHAVGAVAADALTLAARAVAAGQVTDANAGQIHRLGVFKQQSGMTNPALLRIDSGKPGAVLTDNASAAVDGISMAVQEVLHGISSLQTGQLRCLLQMGHYQTLLHQVDGLMARCLGAGQGFAAQGATANPDDIIATLGTLTADLAAAAPGAQSAQWCVVQLAALGVAAAWRLGSYQLLRGYLGIVEAASGAGLLRGASEDDWEVCVGYILEAAHRGSHSDVVTMIKAARQGILGLLPSIAGESYTRAYPDLMKLHMLQEIEDAWGLQQQSAAVGPLQRSRLLRWPERLSLTAPLLSSRAPLLALRRQVAGLLKDNEGMGKAWLQHAKLCRSTGHQEAAETAVLEAQARNVPGALLERCRLLWDRDKGHRAVMELQLVVQKQLEEEIQPNDPGVQHQRAKELLQLTEWMSAVGQGGKEVLCANYDDAIQLDYNWEKAHFSYACYLDQLYKDAKQREGKGPKHGLDRLGGRCRVRREEESPFDYLPSALSHYGESIRAGHKHILQSLPRLLTLYFEFGNRLAASKAINQRMRSAQTQISGVMKGLVRSIPTYKWLLVLPQLTSRLCHPEKDVQEFIQTLLGSIVDHFPQQALWSMTVVVKSTVRARQEIASAVIAAARRRCSESGKRLFDSFNKLMDQLIRACMWQPSGDKRTSKASAQREFKGLISLLPLEVQVPVQTLFTIDLPPGGKLPPGHRPVSMQATIAAMKDEVVIMQSLMKPKKITFVGSDGVEYPFLAKPKDDLRKDYRLMDFAGTLNALFSRQPQAHRRGLSLRTYAVLPLTNDCGILQWVNNLVPFKHACEEVYVKEKIYKRHSTPMQIKKMYDSHSGTRRELMDKVLSLLPPRMNKWFLSRFPDPGTWLAARLAFTRTNAAWAMVGHVLGLGDRHGENIMINALTGETMHVDFGCLFDHGLTLEVPEMVPFRLTQNVVDCFGVSGVEGTFRRAAEMTLQVLRDNKATLMTCAETFLHDPLVDWTKGSRSTSTSSATAVQDQENSQAKDALFVMEGRLSGTLLGVLATPTLPLSCEGQAARLIQEASDHENLGKMYIWWMPWL